MLNWTTLRKIVVCLRLIVTHLGYSIAITVVKSQVVNERRTICLPYPGFWFLSLFYWYCSVCLVLVGWPPGWGVTIIIAGYIEPGEKMDERKIDKKHIATAILFAVKHIPHTDEVTLHKFLELVNTTGSIGWMSEQQLLAEMQLMLKRVPGTCRDSLLTVLELLDICVPLHLNSQQVPALLNQLVVIETEFYSNTETVDNSSA